jgi:prepilin-type N-terminal cleavage/methylation domain-containing protein
MKKGFSLLESLLGLVVFSLIILGSLEFFGTVQTVFFRLQSSQENCQAVWVALERIRTDFVLAGQGLVRPMRLGLINGVERDGETWILRRANRCPKLTADPISGRTALDVTDADGDLAGRVLCLFDEAKGETVFIRESGDGILTLSSPLQHDYRAADATVIVLQKTSLFLEASKGVLRRKNDEASAQPLLEDVHAFELRYDPASCLAFARVSLISAPEEFYEIQFLAKNAALGKTP